MNRWQVTTDVAGERGAIKLDLIERKITVNPLDGPERVIAIVADSLSDLYEQADHNLPQEAGDDARLTGPAEGAGARQASSPGVDVDTCNHGFYDGSRCENCAPEPDAAAVTATTTGIVGQMFGENHGPFTGLAAGALPDDFPHGEVEVTVRRVADTDQEEVQS